MQKGDNVKLYQVMYKGEPIDGYFVSECGKFFGPQGRLTVQYPGWSDTNSYPRITLRGKKYTCHAIMAFTFISFPEHNRPENFESLPVEWQKYIIEMENRYNVELQVDHINGDKNDWNISNLRWVTARENQQYYQKLKRAEKMREMGSLEELFMEAA
ncbi:MAG: HNH endonuclease [Bacteroidetes bacterium]|nr:HNH endonuclease [bacterium]NBP63867.1 HNH endonuclease [Bacteroidota bacterium]